jgi:hypothetical protein
MTGSIDAKGRRRIEKGVGDGWVMIWQLSPSMSASTTNCDNVKLAQTQDTVFDADARVQSSVRLLLRES